MTCIDAQYLYIHRVLLTAIGLWPYHRTKLVELQSSLFSLTMISVIIFQLTTFLTTECSIDFIIRILSTTFFFLLCVIHYYSFWIHTHVVKHLLENLQYVCNELKDENEIAIIKKYGYIAKCLAIMIIFCAMCGIGIFSFLPIMPRMFGISFLINKSESLHNMQIATEYFIDQEKHFYCILLHLYIAVYMGVSTLVGIAITITGYFIHFCGLFNIASYRIEQAMRISSHKVTYCKDKSEIDKKIGHAVEAHRTAIGFSEFFVSNFEGTFFYIIAVTVLCLSFNLFQVFQVTLLQSNVEEFLLHCGFAFSIIIYSFMANYTGQEIIDHYNNMFSTAYNAQWYMAPLRVQRLILFLLQRGCKIYGIKIGGLLTASLECFATLLTTSISYFTVIYSTQN